MNRKVYSGQVPFGPAASSPGLAGHVTGVTGECIERNMSGHYRLENDIKPDLLQPATFSFSITCNIVVASFLILVTTSFLSFTEVRSLI